MTVTSPALVIILFIVAATSIFTALKVIKLYLKVLVLPHRSHNDNYNNNHVTNNNHN